MTIAELSEQMQIAPEELMEKARAIDPDIDNADEELAEDVSEYLLQIFSDIVKERKKEERAKQAAEKKKEREKKKVEADAKKAEREKKKADAEAVKAAKEEEKKRKEEEKKRKDEENARIEREKAMTEAEKAKAAADRAEQERKEAERKAKEALDIERRADMIRRQKEMEIERKKKLEQRRAVLGDSKPLTTSRIPTLQGIQAENPGSIIDLKDDAPAKTGMETFKVSRMMEGDLESEEDEILREAQLRRHSHDLAEHVLGAQKTQRRGPRRMRRSKAYGPKPKTEAEILAELEGGKVVVDYPATVKELSQRLGIKANTIIAKLVKNGVFVTINDPLNEDHVQLVGMDFGIEITINKAVNKEDQLIEEARVDDNPDDLKPRAPIVTILGHVDHGKTTLLDTIRKANVAAKEAGGITQHIGSYKVRTPTGHEVVFVDTPGHEAFTEMRARGANVTDIVVLVVAADDGIMPQTVESISHARAAEVPLVVAINKMDKPGANPMKVKQELTKYELTPEEWGGNTICCEVSGLTGKGIENLLEMLHLQSEILELKANPNKAALGTCLEAELTEDLGVVCKAVVQEGTLNTGDMVLCGSAFGRVKTIYDSTGRVIKSAGPSTPVAFTGLDMVPSAGDHFYGVKDQQTARGIAEKRREKARELELAEKRTVTLENLFSHIEAGKVKEVRVVLKTDVMGSAEVLKKSLSDLRHDEVRVKVLHSAVGSVSESDVLLAAASDAVILGFNVSIDARGRATAEEKQVDIKIYKIIYEMIDDVKLAMEGMLEMEAKEEVTGHVEVRQVFKTSKLGNIAGCFVTDGIVKRGGYVRVFRAGQQVHPAKVELAPGQKPHRAKLASLKRFQDDAKEVREGFECGLRVEGFDRISVGDVVEAYEVTMVKRTLNLK